MATSEDAVPPDMTVGPGGELLENPRRRDYLQYAAVSVAAVGVGITVLPLVNSMNPDASVLALSTTEVDLSAIEPGQAIKASYRKQPLFVRNLTPAEVAAANAVRSEEH